MRKYPIIKAFVCLLVATFSGFADETSLTIEGVSVSAVSELKNGEDLVLNGAGVRKKMMFKLYVGALYLKAQASDPEVILSAVEPMRLVLSITSPKINSKNMTKATLKGFKNSTGGNTKPIEDEIDTFLGAFAKPIQQGDVFTITYLPGTGVEILKNGAIAGQVADTQGFKTALWGIWLGEKPAQESLKSAMLGVTLGDK